MVSLMRRFLLRLGYLVATVALTYGAGRLWGAIAASVTFVVALWIGIALIVPDRARQERGEAGERTGDLWSRVWWFGKGNDNLPW